MGNPAIWEYIDHLIGGQDQQVCIVGDFNAVASSFEKWGGSEEFSAYNIAFRNWIHGAGLVDLGHNGPAYTWSNMQDGSANIAERLDRALATISWTMNYKNAVVFHLPRFKSDHSPILLKTRTRQSVQKRKFRSENWWLLKEGFKEVCYKAATIGNADWVNTRKSLKKEVKTWVRTSKTPNQMIKEIESDMHKLNSVQPDQYDKEKVRELQAEHDRCLLMQEYYWHQRSRINWALFGDSNTKFYHASATTRKRRNSITAIQNSDGEWETGVKEIRSAFITHFRGIYTAGHGVPISQVISVYIL